jgi:hypothetical protein
MTEKQKFDLAMTAILRADPKTVKDAVNAEIKAHSAERKERGERKRGRKPKKSRITSASGHASDAKD